MTTAGEVRWRTSSAAFATLADGRFVALHARDIEPFPFSIVLPFLPRALAPGARFAIDGDRVCAGAQCLRSETPAPPPTVAGLVPLPGPLVRAVGGLPAVARRRAELAAPIDAARAHLCDGALDAAILCLLGLGPGLTPSGDDVLLGLAACVTMGGDVWGLSDFGSLAGRCAELGARGTTALSAALFAAAAVGEFCPALHAIFLSKDPAALRCAVTRVAAIGGHSGLDLLCGVTMAAALASGAGRAQHAPSTGRHGV